MKYFIVALLLLLVIAFVLIHNINVIHSESLQKLMLGSMPFLVTFLMIGLYIMLFPKITKKQKLAKCKLPINDKIVDVKIIYGEKNHKKYYPIYKLYHNNRIYIIETTTTQGLFIPKVGEVVPMFINEDDP